MKKLCMILCGMLIAIDSFATTDIAANAESSTCDSGVLGATEGDVNFDAKWAANNVKLRWYNNNTLMQGLADASNTCNYDGALTIPTTAPERTGYIFAGWKVRPNYDFSKLAPGGANALSTGQKRWAKGYYSNTNYCWYKGGTGDATQVSCASDNEFRELEKHEWKVQFSTGTMYGSAHCSAKSGNTSNSTWPAESSSNWLATYDQLENTSGTKQYCWCQATGWKPSTNNPENTIYAQSSVSASSAWVFYLGRGSAAVCAQSCAASCTGAVLSYSAFRRALFTLQ